MEPISALLERYSQISVIALVALVAGLLVAVAIERQDDPGAFEITAGTTPTPGGPIEVYITGAVMRPGVYEMSDGDRVVDLLQSAGGQGPDANLEAINLAVRLQDEDQVLVPRIGQVAAGGVTSGQTSAVAGVTNNGTPVNINTASAGELDALPGIGEVYSQRIVDSRTTEGLFASADDLLNRDVIPRGTYDKIRDLITIGP